MLAYTCSRTHNHNDSFSPNSITNIVIYRVSFTQCPAGEVSGRSLSAGRGGTGGGRQDKDDPVIDASSAKLWDTEAQRWGNFYGKARPPGVDPFSSQRSCWKKPRSKCDVTEYGDRYVVCIYLVCSYTRSCWIFLILNLNVTVVVVQYRIPSY